MRARAGFGIAITAALFAACGSGGPSATSVPSVAPSPAATAAATITPPATVAPRPTGPATFTLTVATDPNVPGTWATGGGINCSNPTLAGLNILTFATSPDAQVTLVLTFTAGQVNVSERAGSGATYTAREFKGTGVSGYDPARGVTFDSDLEIVPTPSISPGTLATVTHVAGAVDCAGQTTGTSTVVASGSSAEGTVAGSFTQFRVICTASTANGNAGTIIAVLETATPHVYLINNFPSNGNATIFTITQNPTKQHTYVIDTTATSSYTVTATGIHVEADYVEVLPQGSTDTPHRIHLAGDATCGTFNTAP